MILLYRLRGEELVLNADLIEAVEPTPDTVVTLIDGRKLVVLESPGEIIEKVRLFRASILRAADDRRLGAVVNLHGEG